MKNILIHTCCGPCFTGIYEDITVKKEIFDIKEDVQITSIYYNPNIHPKFEHDRRKDNLVKFTSEVGCTLVTIDGYDLNNFITNVINLDKDKFTSRCEYCYYIRLKYTFEYAKENGFDSVMTTLSISPYQNQDMIKKIGKMLEEEYSIKYLHYDYVKIFRHGQKLASDYELYKQKYCGCVFSMDSGKWVY